MGSPKMPTGPPCGGTYVAARREDTEPLRYPEGDVLKKFPLVLRNAMKVNLVTLR
jgi:hypothetical protein